MAKTMARIEGVIVINIESWADSAKETDTLKDPGDRPVGIGDTYMDGKWYREGVEILTPLEAALAENERLQEQLDSAYTEESLKSAYEEGVNSV